MKWWGGWSSSENVRSAIIYDSTINLSDPQVGTIMRYLLDELMSYEEGFGDIMMGDRASDRHETFMGTQNLATSISRGEFLAFEERVMQKVQDLLTNQNPMSKSALSS